MRIMPYRRDDAVNYAHTWAFGRNRQYFDFTEIGGDCTNYASQCLLAGTGVMNYTETFGWYYRSLARRAPAWTGVHYFYNFITRKTGGLGPFGREGAIEALQPGDFIQLSFDGVQYGHNPIVVAVPGPGDPAGILVAAHSNDSDWRPLNTYEYIKARYICIEGYRAP